MRSAIGRVIESEEREMIYNVLTSATLWQDIMIPGSTWYRSARTQGYEESKAMFKECMYTRIPVFREDKDNIMRYELLSRIYPVEEREFSVSEISCVRLLP